MQNALWIMMLVASVASAQQPDRWQITQPDPQAKAANAEARARANEQLNLDRTNRTVESYRPRGSHTVCTTIGGVVSCSTY